ncbi:MAG: hypothetical protein HIU81_13255 [Acidobacteria bacterium]|nr:hypothetical protein [Acidobacteriota bacterium]
MAIENEHAHPLEASHEAISFSSLDWGSSKDTAWIYGIVIGWGGPAANELAEKFGWSPEVVDRMRKLHKSYRAKELKESR